VTAHAAIVARSLGIPMVVGLGDDLARLPEGELLLVDGSRGVAVGNPEPEEVERGRAAMRARALARRRALSSSGLPAITVDGRRVTVLVNAAGASEVVAGLETGADGVGLLRTELAFLDADRWPTEAEHRRVLEPVLDAVGDRSVTVRVLDFGGDKTPPFLEGDRRRGIELLASAPEALDAQLRAILAARGGAELRVLVPMVRGPADLRFVAERLRRAVAAVPGREAPAIGAMIETRDAVATATAIARESDFLSLGTNDLTCDALRVERFSAARGLAHHPQVLGLVAQAVWAAREARVPIEVCGEAASDPMTLPVFVGLGVDELSVGAARVGLVRSWVRAIAASDARQVARRAVEATSIADVAEAVRPLSRELELLEVGYGAGQPLDGGVRVGALGPQR
jgi:phosphoenolpyruvate-protein kinase (PTS system EI component)